MFVSRDTETRKTHGLFMSTPDRLMAWRCSPLSGHSNHKKPVLDLIVASDATWRHRSGSTLAKVMACCLTTPSYYLNKCWIIISQVLWHFYLNAILLEISKDNIHLRWKSYISNHCQISLQWRHNGCDSTSNHRHLDWFTQPFLQAKIKENMKVLCHWSLWWEFTGVTDEFPAQTASNAENVSIWWRHHGEGSSSKLGPIYHATL